MIAGYEIAVAIPPDIPGLLALQDANQPDRDGILSARFPHEWIQAAIANEAIVVARRDDKIAGYVVSGELSAQAHVPVVQAMLRAYAPPPNSYLYGPNLRCSIGARTRSCWSFVRCIADAFSGPRQHYVHPPRQSGFAESARQDGNDGGGRVHSRRC